MIRRFRFRYSLRLMLCLSSLACLFFASWPHCRHLAIADVEKSTGLAPTVTAPFLLQITQSDNVTVRRTHHVWCFGAIVDLPFVSEYPETAGIIFGGVRPQVISRFQRSQQINAGEIRLRLTDVRQPYDEPRESYTLRMPVVPGPVAPPRDSDEREDQSDKTDR